MSFNPAIAAVLAYFYLGESLSALSIVGMAATLSGISLVILENPRKSGAKFKITKFGVICGFIAAAGQGSGLIFAKLAYAETYVHSIVATLYRIAPAVIVLLPLAAIFKKWKNPIKVFGKDKRALGLVALGSIIGPYLGITLSFVAVVNAKVGIASTLMSTMPIIMLPMAKIYYKEKISFKAVLGAFIAVGGVAILFLT